MRWLLSILGGLSCTLPVMGSDNDFVILPYKASEFDTSGKNLFPIRVRVPADKFSVFVDIYNRGGRRARSLEAVKKSGQNYAVASWDGRDNVGNKVIDEAYSLAVRTDVQLEQTVLDFRENRRVVPRPVAGTMDAGLRLSTIIHKPARVQVRIGINGGPLLRTLADWKPSAAGKLTIPWDGLDQSGIDYIAENKNLSTVIYLKDLPAHSIITFGQNSTQNQLNGSALALSVNATSSDNAQSPVIVAVATKLQLPIDPELFEVVFYVDNLFVSEEERGYLPITWHWNTAGFSSGPHTLTVNVLRFDDTILVDSTVFDLR